MAFADAFKAVAGAVKSAASASKSSSSSSGKTVQADSSGNAPTGTKVGDTVTTKGGTYKVVDKNTPGASYNPDSGLYSVKVDDKVTNPASGSSGGSGGSPGYVPKGNYLDQGLSASDKAAVEALQAQWEAAKAAGDQTAMQNYHSQAESIRAKYGYSGGGDGSQFIYQEPEEEFQLPQTALPSYQAQTGAVNNVYDAASKAALAALQSAYDKNKLEYEALKEKLPALYQKQANQVSANAEKEKANFNEMAAYQGMNTGTGSQAKLAMANQAQGDLGDIRLAEANAIADAENDLTALYVEYQNSIAEAVANNEYERAAALLKEYQKAAESVVSTAQNQAYLNLDTASHNQGIKESAYQKNLELAEALASFGDFSGYRNLGFSDDMIAKMTAVWKAANPGIAWALGTNYG